MRKRRTPLNRFWTGAAIVVTGLSLTLTGCSRPEAKESEDVEFNDPMAPAPRQTADYTNAIASVEEMLTTQKLNARQERSLRKLLADLKENADLRTRYEKAH